MPIGRCSRYSPVASSPLPCSTVIGRQVRAAVIVLAARYKITARTIRHVRARKTWKRIVIPGALDEAA